MWSGETACSQPPRRATPWTVRTLEEMPSIAAPMRTSMRARSCTCGSQAALRMTVVPGVSAAAMSAFSVPITDGSSMKKSTACEAVVGRLDADLGRGVLDVGAEGDEGVEVRVEAAAADDVAAGRRHQGGAEARQQRAGEQEGRADALGEVGVDLGARHVAPARSRTCCRRSSRPRRRGRPAGRPSPACRGCAARCAARPRPRSGGRRPAGAERRSCSRRGSGRPDSGTPPSMTNFSMRGSVRDVARAGG